MAKRRSAQHWAELVAHHEQSGMTIRQFAQDHDINPHTLSYWRSKLGRTAVKPAAFVEVAVLPTATSSPNTTPMAIRLDRYAATVEVSADTDLAQLRAVLEALC